MKPSKPSHRLNLEAVRNWATSLSPEDHAQWLDNLLERGSERSKEPNAKQEALALKLEQEVQTVLEQVAQALKQEQKAQQAQAELEQALKLEQEARQAQAELEQVAQALAQVLRGAEHKS
jgi:thioredoxin-like negative regulator of GroEL